MKSSTDSRAHELDQALFEMSFPVYDFGEGDVLSYVGNLDGDPLALGCVWNDNDESPLDAGDPVTLVPDILDLDIALIALVDGWLRWPSLMRSRGRGIFSAGLGLGSRPCRQERNTVGLASFDITELDLLLWNFDNVFAVSFFNRGRIQTAKAIRYFHE